MEPSSLPIWAQNAAMIAVAMLSAVIGVYRYLKTEAKEPAASSGGTASVISASFIDSKLLKELIEAMRELQDEQGRDSKKSHRISQDLREAINELNESIVVQTDTTMNLVRFINRETNKNKVPDDRRFD